MAKVLISIEDTQDETGEQGLIVEADFDPQPISKENMTIAQQWATTFIEHILGEAKEAEVMEAVLNSDTKSSTTH